MRQGAMSVAGWVDTVGDYGTDGSVAARFIHRGYRRERPAPGSARRISLKKLTITAMRSSELSGLPASTMTKRPSGLTS
jgi:hypothetical protein